MKKLMIIIALIGIAVGILIGILCAKCVKERAGYTIPYSEVEINSIETMDDGSIVLSGVYYPE